MHLVCFTVGYATKWSKILLDSSWVVHRQTLTTCLQFWVVLPKQSESFQWKMNCNIQSNNVWRVFTHCNEWDAFIFMFFSYAITSSCWTDVTYFIITAKFKYLQCHDFKHFHLWGVRLSLVLAKTKSIIKSCSG